MCVLSGGRILVFGGYDGADFLQDLWILHTNGKHASLSVCVHGYYRVTAQPLFTTRATCFCFL